MDMLGQFSLKGKVALVTGASHGIGFSMAVALAGAGAEIAFNGHSPDRLKAAEAEYAARGIHARGYLCANQVNMVNKNHSSFYNELKYPLKSYSLHDQHEFFH